MFIKVLGSAAGGGFPQWNRNCANCQGLRDGTIQAAPRTQSSIIVSDNGKEWVLCNASPDISQQIAHTPELNKAGVLRGTHIGGIILTDSQIDHTTGLLSLREGCPHRSGAPRRFMRISPPASRCLPCCGTGTAAWCIIPSLRSSLLPLTPVLICSLPRCLSPATRRPIRRIATGRCRVITWRCLSKTAATGRRCSMPRGLGEPDETLLPWLQKADCLLIDGTVWQDDELQAAGVGREYRARYGPPRSAMSTG